MKPFLSHTKKIPEEKKSQKKNSKTQLVMKLKNLNCDKTLKKNQIVMKLKAHIVMKLKNSNCDETQKLKL